MPSERSSPLDNALKARLDHRYGRAGVLWTSLETSRDLIDFGSNDFLSLRNSSELRSSFLKELTSETQEFSMGSGRSRILDGNFNYEISLEREISEFHNAPNGLLFTSGFDANVSLLACLPQPGDVIIFDELIHASSHDGMALSRAGRRLPFFHNCLTDFRRVLETCIKEDEKVRKGERNVFVTVEALYSMDGDLAPLEMLLDLLDNHLPFRNGHLIVDEAHSNGVIGARGRGLVCDLGLESRVFARLHTFGKAPGCSGDPEAIVLCSSLVRLYLNNFARPHIFTTAMSFPTLAAIKASYSMLKDVKTELAREQIRNLVLDLHNRLHALVAKFIAINSSHCPIIAPKECPPGPIIPLIVPGRKSLSLAAYCKDQGYSVNAVGPPIVPPDEERIRICVHAANTRSELDGLVSAIEEWLNHAIKANEDMLSEKPRL
ncbi:hypothetical protein MMC14_003438 [Varicellaria rhodocarpa]|nr:hypothetical protein [Varicellaria rhodocarpa]